MTLEALGFRGVRRFLGMQFPWTMAFKTGLDIGYAPVGLIRRYLPVFLAGYGEEEPDNYKDKDDKYNGILHRGILPQDGILMR